MHPLALRQESGARSMKSGDCLIYAPPGEAPRYCIADEFLPDGAAFVTWEDGTYGVVNWSFLYPVN